MSLANKIPPYAEETAESRIGFQDGMLGAQNVTRTFRVYCVNPADNPIDTIEHLTTNDGGAAVGDIYRRLPGHWGDGTWVLGNWTILDHWMGTNVWVLQANYVPSYSLITTSPKWTFRISSVIDGLKAYTEMPWEMDDGTPVIGRGIGPPRYIKRLSQVASGVDSYDGTTIMVDNAATEYIAKSPDPLTGNVSLQLAGDLSTGNTRTSPIDPGLPRYMVGTDIPTRSSVLTLAKVCSTWASCESAAINAMKFLGFVNSGAFWVNTTSGYIEFAGEPIDTNGNASPFLGQMLFSDFQLEPIVNNDSGGQPAFQVTMTFKYRPEGWQHKIWHTYKAEDGSEAKIVALLETPDHPANSPVTETFHIVDYADLTSIVGSFDNA